MVGAGTRMNDYQRFHLRTVKGRGIRVSGTEVHPSVGTVEGARNFFVSIRGCWRSTPPRPRTKHCASFRGTSRLHWLGPLPRAMGEGTDCTGRVSEARSRRRWRVEPLEAEGPATLGSGSGSSRACCGADQFGSLFTTRAVNCWSDVVSSCPVSPSANIVRSEPFLTSTSP